MILEPRNTSPYKGVSAWGISVRAPRAINYVPAPPAPQVLSACSKSLNSPRSHTDRAQGTTRSDADGKRFTASVGLSSYFRVRKAPDGRCLQAPKRTLPSIRTSEHMMLPTQRFLTLPPRGSALSVPAILSIAASPRYPFPLCTAWPTEWDLNTE